MLHPNNTDKTTTSQSEDSLPERNFRQGTEKESQEKAKEDSVSQTTDLTLFWKPRGNEEDLY